MFVLAVAAAVVAVAVVPDVAAAKTHKKSIDKLIIQLYLNK